MSSGDTMPALRELQEGFARGLLGHTVPDLPVRSKGLGAAERLRIYRNNFMQSLSQALRSCYPVVEQIVGAEFFRHAAHAYALEHPSRTGNLHDYGRGFPRFLARYPGARGLTYLPDLARLEWACQEVYHAADAPPLATGALAAVPAERHPALRFRLHPASRLLASRYPVLSIWLFHQPGYRGPDRIDLGKGSEQMLVVRRELEVELHTLSRAEFALLRALGRRRDLGTALEGALVIEPSFDLEAALRRHLALHTLVGCY